MPKPGLEKTQSLSSVISAACSRPAHLSSGNSLRRSASTSIAKNWKTEELPSYSYQDLEYAYVTKQGKRISPAVVYVTNEEEANELLGAFKTAVGFDMEWVISMMSGSRGKKTAVVQVADDKMILVIHLHKMQAFSSKLKELVESTSIIKLGVNIVQDFAKLVKDFGVAPQMGVELRDIANTADGPTMAARGIPEHEKRVKFSLLVRIFLHKELDKGPVKTGNWEKYPLSDIQIAYAANDAHCGFTLYKRLMSIAASRKVAVDFEELAGRVRAVVENYPYTL
ncbi:hypothetical protein M407DRAFT_25126 [Tulasnella calospora MUT 4182]|uniref:3'-5' exonuclease domain-containing protein n=1 Tax=Tulasnella calospora MUT 4182 TaxID=1051891 RepID=A0A0C3QI19_9AGAM|nr:hypothetical protein M407DRAFT_25126 [Tulasnella calospora MUT 4182]